MSELRKANSKKTSNSVPIAGEIYKLYFLKYQYPQDRKVKILSMIQRILKKDQFPKTKITAKKEKEIMNEKHVIGIGLLLLVVDWFSVNEQHNY